MIQEGHAHQEDHKCRRDAELEVGGTRAPVARENEGDPSLLQQQDVDMPVETPGESAFVKTWSGRCC